MVLTPDLLRILVDPEDKGPLYYFAADEFLYNPRSKRRYEIKHGNIPVMLVSDAIVVDESEHGKLSERITKENLEPTGVTQ